MLTVHARESFYLRKKYLPVKAVEELKHAFLLYFFNERACDECELKQDRLASETKLTPTCEECAAFLGGAQLASDVKIGNNRYLKTPIGNSIKLKSVLEKHEVEYKVKRHHPDQDMKRPIKFTGQYRGQYQKEAVAAIIKKKRGVLRSPPRSGKTVMGAAAICRMGKKTLIMASQREWLLGFMETFIGSDTQQPLTNCRKTQIGFAKTMADFEKYDICLVTVQTFYRGRGPSLLRKVRDMFPVMFIDECFPKGTPVTTDKGLVPIEMVADNPSEYKALSFNHETKEWEYKPIVRGYPQKTKKRLMRITVGDTGFVCTEDHEIWSEDRQRYIKAKELRVGESLLQTKPLL